MASTQPNWFLHYRTKGGGLEFAEVLRLDKTVFIRRGKAHTFGTSESREYRSLRDSASAAAEASADLLKEGFALERSWVFRPDVFDFTLLKAEVVAATRLHFRQLQSAVPSTNAFALLSDGGAMTLGPVSHSFPSIQEAVDEQLWNPSEWSGPDDFGFFDIAYRLILSRHRDHLSVVPWDVFHSGFHEAAISALEELVEEGVFGTPSERRDFALLYSVSDSDYIKGSIARLNVPPMTKRFRTWLKPWGGRHA